MPVPVNKKQESTQIFLYAICYYGVALIMTQLMCLLLQCILVHIGIPCIAVECQSNMAVV